MILQFPCCLLALWTLDSGLWTLDPGLGYFLKWVITGSGTFPFIHAGLRPPTSDLPAQRPFTFLVWFLGICWPVPPSFPLSPCPPVHPFPIPQALGHFFCLRSGCWPLASSCQAAAPRARGGAPLRAALVRGGRRARARGGAPKGGPGQGAGCRRAGLGRRIWRSGGWRLEA